MPYIKKFENDNNKYTNKSSRIDVNNPNFTPAVNVVGDKEKKGFEKNLDKWCEIVAFYRWYPDLWYDLITPKDGGSIVLDIDQRVFMRAIARFSKGYYVFPRSWGKTLLQVMSMYHTAIFYPRIKLTLTAQSLRNAAALLKDKHSDILNYYPLMKEEIYKADFSQDKVRIEFHNGSVIDILPNSTSAQGQRRHRGSIEEDNLVDEEVYNNAVKPVFDDPRRTIGKHPVKSPFENHSSISAYTTSGFRGSPAYMRCLNTYNEMIDLTGSMCMGASWKLPSFLGRGKGADAILKDKKNSSPYIFDMNYMSRWTGSGNDCICNLTKLLTCRNLNDTKIIDNEKSLVILSVDVARSDKDGNCQTVITIINIVRFSSGRVKELRVPDIKAISGKLNYTNQSIEIKRLKNKYNAVAIVVDNNGLGKG